MILTEILFVRFQEDLGITNDVGTILARKYGYADGRWQISKKLGA